MNNSQFRKLLDKPARDSKGSSLAENGTTGSVPVGQRSSIVPMAPRTVGRVAGGVDFARQVRERNAAVRPTKKFRSSAPKGAKLNKAYTDRAKAREENEDGEDEKAARIHALEEQMKLDQISRETFEQLREEITGGDISSTHLVKGLDRKLLERVRRGEDVLGVKGSDDTAEAAPDVDEELEKLGEKEIETIAKEKVEKKGHLANPAQLAGQKRSRNEIMAELKAQRQAAMEAKAAPMLNGRWRKVGEQQKSRIEFDHKGREIMITVDEDGVVKKKVRKVAPQAQEEEMPAFEMPDASKPVLGADTVIPEQPHSIPVEEDDDDIFEGAGTEYNPLGDAEDDDEDTDEEEELKQAQKTAPPAVTVPDAGHDLNTEREAGEASDDEDSEEGHLQDTPAAPPARRSYFNDATGASDTPTDHFVGIQKVLQRVAQLDPANREADDDDERDGETEEARKARLKRRAEMLTVQDRDLDDMDMGFGGSRLEDEADGDEEAGKKIRLSEWKGGVGEYGEDTEGREGAGGRDKRKRKPKKRKGDVNNAADIMRVIEGRKGGGR
ncbi:hypothetical protein LTR62_001168 [Meristemomyces frigidus]|uniref:RED-like N-terminal domain-containing protein n=1 Tax=Meristemomyces frigidus TaxID=1508187 RepID=A0AAN7YIC7_9PEZI|nr:hypothetical protein LTR62_001168 [Meristemomyces frigidus]